MHGGSSLEAPVGCTSEDLLGVAWSGKPGSLSKIEKNKNILARTETYMFLILNLSVISDVLINDRKGINLADGPDGEAFQARGNLLNGH